MESAHGSSNFSQDCWHAYVSVPSRQGARVRARMRVCVCTKCHATCSLNLMPWTSALSISRCEEALLLNHSPRYPPPLSLSSSSSSSLSSSRDAAKSAVFIYLDDKRLPKAMNLSSAAESALKDPKVRTFLWVLATLMMYVCACLCACVCVYGECVCQCVYVYTYMYIHICICICTCIYISVHIYIYIY
jgi:hypothetical protein